MTPGALAAPLVETGIEPDQAFPVMLAGSLRDIHLRAAGKPQHADVIADVAARVGGAILEGRTCVALADIPGDRRLLDSALGESPVVCRGTVAGDVHKPLVVSADRVYLARYWKYEHAFGDCLAKLNRPANVDEAKLRDLLSRYFPDGGAAKPNSQKVAAATAVLRHLCIISGGPGTGKTSTVVRILAMLLAVNPKLQIAIAAPTGKAAARVQESIRLQLTQLDLPESVAAAMPREPHTIHRLLKYQYGRTTFRHNRDNRLPYDVVVVDEASMLDLALAAKLAEAMRDDARLILLGDKDQLSSVEAGAVYAGVSASRSVSPSWSTRLGQVTGEKLPEMVGPDQPLKDAVVWLEHSYRFGADSTLGQLAAAVNAGDVARAEQVLESGGSEITWRKSYPTPRVLAEQLAAGYRPYVEAVLAKSSPEQVFAAFNGYRVLCSTRAGEYGSDRLGRHLVEVARRQIGAPAGQRWFAGHAVLVTSNDYTLRLFNGDVGIVLPTAAGVPMVHFQGTDGSIRLISPTQLGHVEDSMAMTVHRAQGSEFARVALVIEPELRRGLSRQLIYTGLTRAKATAELIAADLKAIAGAWQKD